MRADLKSASTSSFHQHQFPRLRLTIRGGKAGEIDAGREVVRVPSEGMRSGGLEAVEQCSNFPALEVEDDEGDLACGGEGVS